MYSPAPSPFGNMVGGGGVGTANLSHTSTAMLVPMHSQAGPHSVILGPGGGPPQMGRMKRPFRTITPPTLSPFATPTNNGSICECPRWLLTGFRPSLFLTLCFHRSLYRWSRDGHSAKIRWAYGRASTHLSHRFNYRAHLQ